MVKNPSIQKFPWGYRIFFDRAFANCYLICLSNSHCIAVDIGGDSRSFLDILEEKELQLDGILLTHGHYDHILGVEDVRKVCNVPVWIHPLDSAMLLNPNKNRASLHALNFIPIAEYHPCKEGDRLFVGEYEIQVWHTPGHTRGSVCYYLPREHILFSGDTLFDGKTGRTDLPSGNPLAMQHSVQKLLRLDDRTVLYPGHGDITNIGTLRKGILYR